MNNKPENTNLEGFDCSLPVDIEPTWSQSLIAGCPGAVNELLNRLAENRLTDIYQSSGFFSQPDLALAQAPTVTIHNLERKSTILGSNDAAATPLQMVLAAASISANGVRPAPRLAMAVDTTTQGWVILPAGQKVQAFSTDGISMALKYLTDEETATWHTTASVPTSEGQIHWFVAGTTPDWQGTSLALAVVIEGGTAKETADLGSGLLDSVMLQ